MKSKLLIFLVSGLFLISCSKQTPDNTLLGTYQYPIPDGIGLNAKSEKVTKFEHKSIFSSIGAEYAISFDVTRVDSLVSVISSVSVVLLKGCSSCLFHARLDPVLVNTGSKEVPVFHGTLGIGYYKSSWFSKKLEEHRYVIHSDGRCVPM